MEFAGRGDRPHRDKCCKKPTKPYYIIGANKEGTNVDVPPALYANASKRLLNAWPLRRYRYHARTIRDCEKLTFGSE